MARERSGNPSAEDGRPGTLEELYIRHAPEAIRLAYLLTRDGSVAEDIVQDAFVKVAGRFRHLRAMGAFEAYLRRTVVNLCFSHHRKQCTARAYLERERRHQGRDRSDAPDLETRDVLRNALELLPDRQRAAVVLRFYGDLSEQQVADALACSVTAARSLVFRAMAVLREHQGKEER